MRKREREREMAIREITSIKKNIVKNQYFFFVFFIAREINFAFLKNKIKHPTGTHTHSHTKRLNDYASEYVCFIKKKKFFLFSNIFSKIYYRNR